MYQEPIADILLIALSTERSPRLHKSIVLQGGRQPAYDESSMPLASGLFDGLYDPLHLHVEQAGSLLVAASREGLCLLVAPLVAGHQTPFRDLVALSHFA